MPNNTYNNIRIENPKPGLIKEINVLRTWEGRTQFVELVFSKSPGLNLSLRRGLALRAHRGFNLSNFVTMEVGRMVQDALLILNDDKFRLPKEMHAYMRAAIPGLGIDNEGKFQYNFIEDSRILGTQDYKDNILTVFDRKDNKELTTPPVVSGKYTKEELPDLQSLGVGTPCASRIPSPGFTQTGVQPVQAPPVDRDTRLSGPPVPRGGTRRI